MTVRQNELPHPLRARVHHLKPNAKWGKFRCFSALLVLSAAILPDKKVTIPESEESILPIKSFTNLTFYTFLRYLRTQIRNGFSCFKGVQT